MIRRIIESSFPGRFVVNGSNKYVTIPSSVIQRMALTPGEYLDVTVRLPKTDKYEEEGLLTLSDAAPAEDKAPPEGGPAQDTKRPRRRKQTDSE